MSFADFIGGVGDVLDTPRAVAHTALARLAGDETAHPLDAMFDTNQRKSGRDLYHALRAAAKRLAGDKDAQIHRGDEDGLGDDAAGLLLETLLDPTNLFGGGIAAKLAKGLKKAKLSNKASKAARAAGHMPEEVAKLTKIVDESGKPLRTFHGTKHKFDQYDTNKLDDDALYGKGIYTTVSPEVASEYTEKGAAPPHLVRKYQVNRDRSKALQYAARDLGEPISAHPDAQPIYAAIASGRLPIEEGDRQLRAIENSIPLSARAQRMIELAKRSSRRSNEAKVVPQNVRMQYIDARKPFDMSRSTIPQQEANQMIHDFFGSGMSVRGDIAGSEIANMLTPRDTERLRAKGYDAIVHTGGNVTGGQPHKVVIAFDPSQIYKPYIAPALQPEHHRRLYGALAALAAHNALKEARHLNDEQ